MNQLYKIQGTVKQSLTVDGKKVQSHVAMDVYTIAVSPELALDSVSSFCSDGVVVGCERLGSGW